MWKKMRQVLNHLAVGALVGFGIWSVVGSWVTGLMFGSVGGSISCRSDVEVALDRYIIAQVYSAGAGAIVFAIATWLVRRAWGRRRARRRASVQEARGIPGGSESP